jgi:hypothetical protein
MRALRDDNRRRRSEWAEEAEAAAAVHVAAAGPVHAGSAGPAQAAGPERQEGEHCHCG